MRPICQFGSISRGQVGKAGLHPKSLSIIRVNNRHLLYDPIFLVVLLNVQALAILQPQYQG